MQLCHYFGWLMALASRDSCCSGAISAFMLKLAVLLCGCFLLKITERRNLIDQAIFSFLQPRPCQTSLASLWLAYPWDRCSLNIFTGLIGVSHDTQATEIRHSNSSWKQGHFFYKGILVGRQGLTTWQLKLSCGD